MAKDSYDTYEQEQKQRRKTIILGIAFGVVVLFLLIWAFVSAVQSTKPKLSEENKGTVISSQENTGAKAGTETNTNKTSEAANKTETASAAATSAAAASLPATGPEDYLPLILIAGVLATYISSAVMLKREA